MTRRILIHAAAGTAAGAALTIAAGVVLAIAESRALKKAAHGKKRKPWLEGLS